MSRVPGARRPPRDARRCAGPHARRPAGPHARAPGPAGRLRPGRRAGRARRRRLRPRAGAIPALQEIGGLPNATGADHDVGRLAPERFAVGLHGHGGLGRDDRAFDVVRHSAGSRAPPPPSARRAGCAAVAPRRSAAARAASLPRRPRGRRCSSQAALEAPVEGLDPERGGPRPGLLALGGSRQLCVEVGVKLRLEVLGLAARQRRGSKDASSSRRQSSQQMDRLRGDAAGRARLAPAGARRCAAPGSGRRPRAPRA